MMLQRRRLLCRVKPSPLVLYDNGVIQQGLSFSNLWNYANSSSYTSYAMSTGAEATVGGSSVKTLRVHAYDSSATTHYARSSWVETNGFTGALLKKYSKINITVARKIENNPVKIHRLGLYSSKSAYDSNLIASVSLGTAATGTAQGETSYASISSPVTYSIDIPSTLSDSKTYYLGLVLETQASLAYWNCYSYTTKLWLE